jgi:hypothetical protein
VGVLGNASCDLSQNPYVCHRAGPFIGSLRKSSQMVWLGPEWVAKKSDAPAIEDHIFTFNELSFAYGWPTIATCPRMEKYRNVLNYEFSKGSHCRQTKLLGDGMSLNMVQAWYLYIFSHCVRRDYIEALTIQMQGPAADVSTEEYSDDDGEVLGLHPTASAGMDAAGLAQEEAEVDKDFKIEA